MMRLNPFMLTVLVLLSAAHGPAWSGEFTIRELPIAFTEAAVDATTGEVVLLDTEGSQLWLLTKDWFEGKADFSGPVTLPMRPLCAVFKTYKGHRRLIVGGIGTGSLIMIDPKTLESITPFEAGDFKGNSIEMLSASADDRDPFVYGAGRLSGGAGGFVINVARTTPRAVPLYRSTACDVVFPSKDGRYLYYGGQSLRFSTLRTARESDLLPVLGSARACKVRGRPLFLPGGELISDKRIYAAPGIRSALILGFQPRCVAGNRPFVAGVKEKLIVVADIRSGQTIVRAKLPEELSAGRSDVSLKRGDGVSRGKITPGIRLLNDARNDRLIVLADKWAGVVRWPELRLPNAPDLSSPLRSPGVALVGQVARIAVPVPADVEIALNKPPAGVEIQGREIRWTPQATDAGDHCIRIDLKRDGSLRSCELQLSVADPGLNMPVPCDSVRITHDGKRVLAWTERSPELVLIDAEKKKVLATRTLPFGISNADIHTKAVVVTGTSDSRQWPVLALQSDTLQTVAEQRGEGRPQFYFFRDSVIVSRKGASEIVRARLPDLIEEETRSVGTSVAKLNALVGQQFFDGVLWNQEEDQPLLLTSEIPKRTGTRSFQTSLRLRSSVRAFVSAAGAPVLVELGRLGDSERCYWGIRRPETPSRRQGRQVPASEGGEQQLRLHTYASPPVGQVSVCGAVNGYQMAVIADSRLMTADTRPFFSRGGGLLRLIRRQSAFLTAVDGSTRLTYPVLGGAAPYDVRAQVVIRRVPRDTPFLSKVPDKSSEFDLDGAGLARSMLKSLTSEWVTDQESGSEIVSRQATAARNRIKRVLGKRVRLVPIPVEMRVTVNDARRKRDSMSHLLYLQLPEKEVVLAVNEQIVSRYSGRNKAAAEKARQWIRRNAGKIRQPQK